MSAHHPPAHSLRHRIALMRRGAVTLLIVSLIGLIAWEAFTGPHPNDFGYRFSPMYILTWQGFGFWAWVAAVLIGIGLINYSWLGREVMIHCPQCGRDNSSKDDWVCPNCGQENRPRCGGTRDSFYTVLTRCKHCGASPAAYRCQQCAHVIPLGPHADMTHYAYRPVDRDR